MKLSLIILSALSVFATAAPAAASAGVVTLEDMLTELATEVKLHSSNMKATVAALPKTADAVQKKAAVASVNKDLTALASAFHTTNAKVNAAKTPTLGDLPSAVLGQLDGKPIVLAKLLLPLLAELNPALQSVLTTLSLGEPPATYMAYIMNCTDNIHIGEVYVALHPLLYVDLPALVTTLSGVVSGLLVALAPLLTALGGILGPLLLSLGL